MHTFLEKIYHHSADQAVVDILHVYQDQGFATVNFVYLSNIVAHQLLKQSDKTEKEREYKKILLRSDFLLPDGIALQLLYYLIALFGRITTPQKWLPNLNGTDFIPYFLSEAKKKYGAQKLCILLYGTKPELVLEAKERLTAQGFHVIYAQDGYSDFDREAAQTQLEEYQDTINILIQARSTTKIPLQELWTLRNYQKIQDHHFLVFNAGGRLDFLAGAQKRASKRWRMLKLERLYRWFSDPKRNTQKVLNSFVLIPYFFKYAVFGSKRR